MTQPPNQGVVVAPLQELRHDELVICGWVATHQSTQHPSLANEVCRTGHKSHSEAWREGLREAADVNNYAIAIETFQSRGRPTSKVVLTLIIIFDNDEVFNMLNVLTLQNFFQANKLPYVIFNSLNLTPNLLEPTKFTDLCEQSDMTGVYKQFDMSRIYEDQTFFTYMYDKKAFYPVEGDERYMHPNDEAHAEWAEILFQDIEKTKQGKG